jgi:hypothetical protein
MSNQPISEHIDCGKLVETTFKYNTDFDEYESHTVYQSTSEVDPLKAKKEQEHMIKKYKVNMKSVDQMRKQKAISVNEIMNRVNQSGNDPDKRYCGDLPQDTPINEYEWR